MESEDPAGDLGLGRGLKPGAVSRNYDSDPETLPKAPEFRRHPRHEEEMASECRLKHRSFSLRCAPSCVPKNTITGMDRWIAKTDVEEEEGTLTKLAAKLKRLGSWKSRSVEAPATDESVYEIQGINRHATEVVQSATVCNHSVILEKLNLAQQEVEQLKQELELCQMQLRAKYQATKILQQQLAFAKREKEVLSKSSERLNRGLIQDLNRTQFELNCHESKLMQSQENWSARFDSICLENLQLVAALEEQTLKQRKIFAEKMALCRERDELLALMHVLDRSRYEFLRPSSVHRSDPFDGFTSSELALMGACHCRSESLSPCSCAVTAACLKKEIKLSKEEIAQLKQERDDALTMVDAYRIAFDDQLSRNRSLIRRMTEMCTDLQGESARHCDKSESPVARLFRKGSISSSSCDNSKSFPMLAQEEDGCNGHKTDELMKLLEETVVSKSEALAHQKFATRLLASRVQQLEEKLTSIYGSDAAGDEMVKATDGNL